MTQTLLTPSIIAREAIITLVNQLAMANLVHRDFSNEFVKVGDTITVRKPATFTAAAHNGSTITTQEAVEGSVTVDLDKLMDVSFAVSSKELALDIDDFSMQFIQPAVRAHAQAIDLALCGLYIDVPYWTTVGGTPAIGDLAALDTILNNHKAPTDQRSAVINPATKAKYVVLDSVLHAEKSGSTDALRRASIGAVMGADFYMDQNVVAHTKGTLDAGATLSGTAAALTGTIASGGNALTIKKGDVFSVATLTGYQFVCTEEMTTTAGGGGTLKFYPALPSTISTQVVTVLASHAANLAFHKNAFALVTRPLSAPLGAARAEVINYNGVSLRVVYGYDMQTKKDTISIDCLYGVKTLTPELAVRFAG